MKSFLTVINDLNKSVRQEKIRMAAVAGAIIIGMLFALLSVYAFWNPQDAMKELPVAVVNLDEGTEAGGEYENFGARIAEEIEENDKVGWVVTEENLFRDGIESTEYYFGFVIPKDFSQRILDAKDHPQEKPVIEYLGNMRKNFLMSQMAVSVKSALSEIIAESISEEYADALIGGLQDASDGMDEAADGSDKIAEGAVSAAKGAGSLAKGAGKIAGGAGALKDGLADLKDGAKTLSSGAGRMSGGIAELDQGAGSLEGGLETLQKGAESLADGAEDLREGTETLAESMSQFFDGLDTAGAYATDGAERYVQNAENYVDGFATLYEMIRQSSDWYTVPEKQRETLDQLYAGTGIMKQGGTELTQSVAGGFSQLSQTATALEEGATHLQEGATILSGGAVSLEEGIRSASSGAAKLHAGTSNLAFAGQALSQGATRLASGASTATKGAETLSAGAGNLAKGSRSLASGLVKLEDGSAELTDALRDGSKEIADGLGDNPDELAQFVSDPLETKETIYGETNRYGAGLAPMFLSLGLWLGTLILFFAIPFMPTARITSGRIAQVFGGYTTFLMYDVIVALSIGAGGIFLVGLEPTSAVYFFLWAIFSAATFLAILFMLHRTLGELPGKAAGILFVVFQISACGGAMAIDLIPGWLQQVSKVLPMRYTIDGFREVIFGGDMTNLVADILPLGLWTAGSLLLALAGKGGKQPV